MPTGNLCTDGFEASNPKTTKAKRIVLLTVDEDEASSFEVIRKHFIELTQQNLWSRVQDFNNSENLTVVNGRPENQPKGAQSLECMTNVKNMSQL